MAIDVLAIAILLARILALDLPAIDLLTELLKKKEFLVYTIS